MAERIWDKFLTERDKQVFGAAGYGQRAGFGERPAVIVVDVNYNFTGDKPEPILDSIKRWPNSCGEDAWESMRHIKRLLDAARDKGVPVIYTTGTMRADGWDRGSWAWKNSRTGEWESHHDGHGSNLDGNEINAEIAIPAPTPAKCNVDRTRPAARSRDTTRAEANIRMNALAQPPAKRSSTQGQNPSLTAIAAVVAALVASPTSSQVQARGDMPGRLAASAPTR